MNAKARAKGGGQIAAIFLCLSAFSLSILVIGDQASGALINQTLPLPHFASSLWFSSTGTWPLQLRDRKRQRKR